MLLTDTNMAKKKKSTGIKVEVKLPAGVTAEVSEANQFATVVMKKGNSENKRTYDTKVAGIAADSGKIVISAPKDSRKYRKVVGTFEAHITNQAEGVEKIHVYKLKICSGHFPMSVTVSGDTLTIKNFLGETVPRTLKLRQGVSVKVSGTEIKVESTSIELAGQTAASIESLSKIKQKDSRIFQDGIYITEKDGEPV
ncbi:50S ribosomal protein L6 [Candidatus Woesearchaeota archaeon]|nr:50S ribosomal protein L6 [Candidatus Woesearchaeota archaeon]